MQWQISAERKKCSTAVNRRAGRKTRSENKNRKANKTLIGTIDPVSRKRRYPETMT